MKTSEIDKLKESLERQEQVSNEILERLQKQDEDIKLLRVCFLIADFCASMCLVKILFF